jgi:hypothetical protein
MADKPKKNPYGSFSIKKERYAKIRREFETSVDTDDSFTEWYTKMIEAGLARARFLKKNFPDLKIVKAIPNGVIIDDSKRNDVVKVFANHGKISCSSENNKEQYIIFACLSPEFNPQ